MPIFAVSDLSERFHGNSLDICLSSLFFSADQLAEAKKGLEESGNAQNLRKENIELFKENKRLKDELEASRKLLSEARKLSKEQADRDAESIKLLQDTLEARLAEIKAVDDELLSRIFSSTFRFTRSFSRLIPLLFLAGHYISDRPSNENRMDLIKGLGEMILDFSKASRRFVRKLFPSKDANKIVVEEVPELMREVANKQTGRLQSAVRGGARTALALMLAHYRTAKPARLASGFPSTVTEEETAELFTKVSGYATRIAEMVKEDTHFDAVPCPEIPEVFSDEESSDEDN